MNAHDDYKPPMGPGILVLKRAALIIAGVLAAVLGLAFAAFTLLAFVVVASTGTGASSTMVDFGWVAAVVGVCVCALFMWLSTRLKSSQV